MKRFFSFSYRFPAVDREWTAAHEVCKWLSGQLGHWIQEDTHDPDHAEDAAPAQDAAPARDAAPAQGAASAQGAAPAQGAASAHDEAPAHDAGPAHQTEESLQAAALEAQAQAEGHAHTRKTKKNKSGRDDLAQLRQDTHNTLHLCSVLMENRVLQVHGRMLQAVMDILRKAMAMDLAAQKTQEGCFHFAGRRVQEWPVVPTRIMALLMDMRLLQSLGLPMAATLMAEEPDEYETNIAHQLLALVVEAVAAHAWPGSSDPGNM